jgi:hypothetical protein
MLGAHGFGHFDRNQSGSAAGAKPGIPNNRLDKIVGQMSGMQSNLLLQA